MWGCHHINITYEERKKEREGERGGPLLKSPFPPSPYLLVLPNMGRDQRDLTSLSRETKRNEERKKEKIACSGEAAGDNQLVGRGKNVYRKSVAGGITVVGRDMPDYAWSCGTCSGVWIQYLVPFCTWCLSRGTSYLALIFSHTVRYSRGVEVFLFIWGHFMQVLTSPSPPRRLVNSETYVRRKMVPKDINFVRIYASPTSSLLSIQSLPITIAQSKMHPCVSSYTSWHPCSKFSLFPLFFLPPFPPFLIIFSSLPLGEARWLDFHFWGCFFKAMLLLNRSQWWAQHFFLTPFPSKMPPWIGEKNMLL